MVIHNEVRCDGCGKVEAVDGMARGRWRAHIAREQLKAMGWAVGLEGGKDLCPECRKKRLPFKAR